MRKSKSLTLVELLIASSILGLVMATVYSAFYTGIFGYKDIEKNIEICQSAGQILERLNLDLRNSFYYSKDESKFEGETDRLSFLTLVASYEGSKIIQDYALVSYKLENKRLSRLCRKAKESLSDKSEIESEEMAGYIGKLIFSYGFTNADTKTMEFKDKWDDKKRLPQMVEISLSIADKDSKISREFRRTVFLPLAE